MLPDTNPVTVLVAGAPRILPELAPEQRHADEEGNLCPLAWLGSAFALVFESLSNNRSRRGRGGRDGGTTPLAYPFHI